MKDIHTENRFFSTILLIQIVELILVVTLLVFSFMAAGILIYNDYFPYGSFDGIVFSVLASLVAVAILSYNKYFNFLDTTFAGIMGKVTWVVLMINFILIIMLYFVDAIRLSLYYFIIALTLQVGFLLLIKIFTSMLKHNILSKRNSLILGKKEDENVLLHSIQKSCEGDLIFLDITDENLKEYIDKADNIYLMNSSSIELKNDVVTYCEANNKKLFIVPEIHEIAMRNSQMSQINDIPLFTIESFQLTESQSIIKRLMDIPLSLIGIVLTLPIIAAFAIAIKVEDGGPVFFKQIRSGIHGKEFVIFKLRSMIMDAEKDTGSVFAKDNDPRITKVGRLMRSARIDEFPQFYNVLFGSMSIVGPRPERPIFVEEFCKNSPEYIRRLAVKPGITGLAQVLANYSTTSENKLKFDLIYIQKFSSLLDLKILFKTVIVLFSREKAKGFTETTEASDLIIEEEKAEEDTHCLRSKMSRRITYNYLKASMIVLCCAVIISGSFVMRYNSMIVTLLEANKPPIERSNELYSELMIPLNDLEVGLDTEMIQQNETNKIIVEAEIPMVNLPNQLDIENDQNIKIYRNMTLQQKIHISFELSKKLNLEDMAVLENISEDGFSEKELVLLNEMMVKIYNNEDRSNLKKLLANL